MMNKMMMLKMMESTSDWRVSIYSLLIRMDMQG